MRICWSNWWITAWKSISEYTMKEVLFVSASKNGISAVCGGLCGGYEAEAEIEHIFDQEAHYGNEDYSLF